MKRNTLVNFRAEDFEARVDSADEAKRRNRRAQQQKRSGSKKSEAATDSNEVPTGTSKEVLEWVGDDKDRAIRALDTENSHEKPRKTLVTELEDVRDRQAQAEADEVSDETQDTTTEDTENEQ